MADKKRPGVGVGILILRDNKVLLGKRHVDPEKADSELHGAGTWTMPGGKIDFGEKPHEAAARELLEETDIKTDAEQLKLVSVSNDAVEDAHFITLGFMCKNLQDEPKVMEPDEITEWRWFDINSLPEPIFFPSRKVLDNYLTNTLYRH